MAHEQRPDGAGALALHEPAPGVSVQRVSDPGGLRGRTGRAPARLQGKLRIWALAWLRFQRTGRADRFAVRGNRGHELLTMDVGPRLNDRDDLGLAEFLFDTDPPEIKLPVIQPGLGPTAETMGQSFLLA